MGVPIHRKFLLPLLTTFPKRKGARRGRGWSTDSLGAKTRVVYIQSGTILEVPSLACQHCPLAFLWFISTIHHARNSYPQNIAYQN
jgi:hypothetical protein